jgi:hypothetical protein
MITTQLVALDIIRGAGGSPIPPPVPTPTPQGGGHGYGVKKRKYVKLRNGQQFEIDDQQELESVVRHILEERAADSQKPAKPAKVSRKIRQRVKKPDLAEELTQITDWHDVFAALQNIQLAVIGENILLDLIRKTLLAEIEDEAETELLLYLM